jgi:predicted ATPase
MKPKNFLRGFRVQNFKAIQDGRPVTLTPLTVLIGNNGSGKSSFVEGMETYRNIVTDGLDAAMQRWFGLEHVWNKRARRRPKLAAAVATYENPMRFSMNGRAGLGSYRADMTVAAKPGFSGIFIQEENIGMPDGVLHRGPNGKCAYIRGDETGKANEVADPGRSAMPRPLREIVGGWQFLSLMPDPMGRPAPKKLATNGHLLLNKDGSNIAQYLLNIRERDGAVFDGIVESMKFVLDYAKNFEPVESSEIQRMMYVRMMEADFEIPGWLISTGTIRILALLAVLRNPDPPPLIVVEEIENGLDPRTIHMVLDEIRGAVQGGQSQVILTTHSPYLLDLLPLQTMIIVQRENGGDPIFWRPSDNAQVQEWAKNFAPGQLYTAGRFQRGVQS